MDWELKIYKGTRIGILSSPSSSSTLQPTCWWHNTFRKSRHKTHHTTHVKEFFRKTLSEKFEDVSQIFLVEDRISIVTHSALAVCLTLENYLIIQWSFIVCDMLSFSTNQDFPLHMDWKSFSKRHNVKKITSNKDIVSVTETLFKHQTQHSDGECPCPYGDLLSLEVWYPGHFLLCRFFLIMNNSKVRDKRNIHMWVSVQWKTKS